MWETIFKTEGLIRAHARSVQWNLLILKDLLFGPEHEACDDPIEIEIIIITARGQSWGKCMYSKGLGDG